MVFVEHKLMELVLLEVIVLWGVVLAHYAIRKTKSHQFQLANTKIVILRKITILIVDVKVVNVSDMVR